MRAERGGGIWGSLRGSFQSRAIPFPPFLHRPTPGGYHPFSPFSSPGPPPANRSEMDGDAARNGEEGRNCEVSEKKNEAAEPLVPRSASRTEIADFDYSVGNFLPTMEKVSALCDAPGETNEIQRFSSKYLAVGALPPGSAYHKIGAPFIGGGVIQIWYLLNLDEMVELSEFCPPRPKGNRIRRQEQVDGEQTEFENGVKASTTPRPIGRPRKSRVEENVIQRPRGRPRKNPILSAMEFTDLNESFTAKPRGGPRK